MEQLNEFRLDRVHSEDEEVFQKDMGIYFLQLI